jgi:hypothetical protein
VVKNFSETELLEAFSSLPEEIKKDHWARAYFLSLVVIDAFLGEAWSENHIGPSAPNDSLFKFRPWHPPTLEIEIFRIIELAESMFNLRQIENLSRCLDQMRKSKNPESELAELHIAKMLHVNGWTFSFVASERVRGKDYDFNVDFDGQILCVDAKYKVEDPSAETITKTLHRSRDQLPPDKPGVLIVKVPQTWLQHPMFVELCQKGASDFFKEGTGRIVSVGFYCEPLASSPLGITQTSLFAEITNPRHRHSKDTNWKLFDKWRPLPSANNAMPDWWVRLSDFPRGMLPW